MENKEKFKELLRNEDFVAKLLEMQTPEEVQSEFKSQGVDISIEEVAELGGIINYLIKEEKTQLSEEDLVKISGGRPGDSSGGDPTPQKTPNKYVQTIAYAFGADPEKVQEGRSKKLGELEIIATTAIIAIPIGIAVTKFATWGIDQLIKKLDKKVGNK